MSFNSNSILGLVHTISQVIQHGVFNIVSCTRYHAVTHIMLHEFTLVKQLVEVVLNKNENTTPKMHC